MGAVAAMVILLVFLNLGAVATAADQEVPNFNRLVSASSNASTYNTTLDEKRGIPTGSNPLHNR